MTPDLAQLLLNLLRALSRDSFSFTLTSDISISLPPIRPGDALRAIVSGFDVVYYKRNTRDCQDIGIRNNVKIINLLITLLSIWHNIVFNLDVIMFTL